MMQNTSDYEPFVSVIMPIRNEVDFIARSLGAVLCQDYPPNKIEVLVADGMSKDGTLEVIRTLPGSERVRIIPNPQLKQAQAMNLAIRQARGEIVVRVDGHTIVAPNYVRECVRALAETGAANVGGPMDPVGITDWGKAIAAAGKSAFAVPSAFHVSDQPQYTDTVYMGAWKRTLFEKVGLYNPATVPNEDYELNYRIRSSGGMIYLSPSIRSEYYGRQSLSSLARQYFNYGIGKVQTLAIYPKSIRPRQLVAPVFVLGLFGGGVVSFFHSLLFALWLGAISLYIIINLLFSIRQAQRSGFNLLPRLPFVFFTIHLAWGTGFWIALYRLVRKKASISRHGGVSLLTNENVL